MKLTFTDKNGNVEVLGDSDNELQLKSIASDKYFGDELMIWGTGLKGKSYNDANQPEAPWTCSFEDGSFFSIK